jgi:hypothetical protein
MEAAGAPAAVTTSGALLIALRHLSITRIAAVTPYVEDLTDGLRAYLAEAGVEVVATAGLGLTSEIWTVPHETTAGRHAVGPGQRLLDWSRGRLLPLGHAGERREHRRPVRGGAGLGVARLRRAVDLLVS